MIYIAYKYSNTPDKKQLKKHLETLASIFESKGQPTFILFRDKKKWGLKSHTNKLHSAIFMLYKLLFATQIVAYVDHEANSPGLDFELKYARLLGKPITLLAKSSVNISKLESKVDTVVTFDTYRELNQIETKLPKPLLALAQA